MPADIVARGMADRSARLNPELWPSPWEYLAHNQNDKRLLMIGDSLTTDNAGFYPLEMISIIQQRLGIPGFKYDRFAYAGFRWGDIPFDAILAATPEAKVVTVMLGTNDARIGTNGSALWGAYYASYRQLEAILNTKLTGSALRLLLTPWVRDDITDGYYQPVAEYRIRQARVNQVLRGISRKYCGVEALDTYSLTEGQTNWYAADGLHFNQLGGRHMAVALLNHLRKLPQFTADHFFLTGKPYTITTDLTQSPSYAETDRKLTARNPQAEAQLLTNQIGYQAAIGQTKQVIVNFWFGENTTINDLLMRFGGISDGYAPDSIQIEKYSSGAWAIQATLNATSEESPDYPLAGYTLCPPFVNYVPATPFLTKGLRLTFTKTFATGRDWFFMGQIEATKLAGYTGTVS